MISPAAENAAILLRSPRASNRFPMKNSSDLERMVTLLAFSAEVMRKLARPQDENERIAICEIADDLDQISGRLIEVLFPERTKPDSVPQRTERGDG